MTDVREWLALPAMEWEFGKYEKQLIFPWFLSCISPKGTMPPWWCIFWYFDLLPLDSQLFCRQHLWHFHHHHNFLISSCNVFFSLNSRCLCYLLSLSLLIQFVLLLSFDVERCFFNINQLVVFVYLFVIVCNAVTSC